MSRFPCCKEQASTKTWPEGGGALEWPNVPNLGKLVQFYHISQVPPPPQAFGSFSPYDFVLPMAPLPISSEGTGGVFFRADPEVRRVLGGLGGAAARAAPPNPAPALPGVVQALRGAAAFGGGAGGAAGGSEAGRGGFPEVHSPRDVRT